MNIVRNSDNCIFCKGPLSSNNKTTSHLIPELFGKNSSRNNFECDSCNAISGKWESSLGTFLTPIRIVSNIKNKRGKIPKFKSRKDGLAHHTEIYKDDSGKLKGVLGTKDDFEIDKNGNGRIRFRLGRCNPYDIYRAFLKIGLSLMPNDKLIKEEWMLKYLFENKIDNNLFPIMYMAFLDNQIFPSPFFQLGMLHKQYKYHPQYLLTAYFGKAIIHMVLPLQKPKKRIFINMPPIINILGPRASYEFEKIDLSDTENKKWDIVFKISLDNKSLGFDYSI